MYLFTPFFQVHKEAIDKVPNSLPNRSNIEIEIYGMEGIPPEDVKEHEKQKTGIKTFLYRLWLFLDHKVCTIMFYLEFLYAWDTCSHRCNLMCSVSVPTR